MTFTYRHKKQLILGCLGLVLLLVLSSFFIYKSFYKKDKNDDNIVLNTTRELEEVKREDDATDSKEEIYYQVDIKGEVINPDIYTVKDGSRVIDVIRLAGGLTNEADTSVLNLSKKVKDEMVIIVYSYSEVANFTLTLEKEKIEQEACLEYNDIKNDACIEDNEEEASSVVISGKISLNEATLEELMMLPGIGESKAKAIIAYREEVGAFQSIEELLEVNGIGDTLFDQIKENITI